MKLSIQKKLFASYILVVVICIVLFIGISIYVVTSNFDYYSQIETLDPVERLILALFNEGKIPDFRYIPRSMENQFFNSITQSLIITGIGVLSVAVILSFIFSKTIVRPTRKMIEITRQIADGDYSKRVNVRSSDELGDLGKSLNQMAENLEKIESLRRELVSNVSHELSTPLTNISGYLEALHDRIIEGQEPTEKALNILREEVERLTSMVIGLRELSRIESAGFKLTIEPCDVGKIIREVVSTFTPRFESRNINVSLNITSDLPVIEADKKALNQILVNLIDNSVNYSPDNGKIIIFAGKKNSFVEISVIDDGIGIDESDLQHIFERFYRADKSRSRNTGGTGIGLAIVRELVKLQGGEISVISKSGEGSTFTFRLPVSR
jgi:two-component system sensor histidine kinase BaeS